MHRHILIPRQTHVQTMLSTKLSIQIDTHIYQSPCESNCVAYAAAALILCMKEQHGKKRKNHRLNLNISFPSPSNANEHYGSWLEYFCIVIRHQRCWLIWLFPLALYIDSTTLFWSRFIFFFFILLFGRIFFLLKLCIML